MKITLRKILFYFVAVLFIITLKVISAQPSKIDSLKKNLNETKVDANKSELLLQLARLTNSLNKEDAIKYYIEALPYQLVKFNKAAILDTIGLFNWQLGNFPEAIIYFEQSLSLFDELQDSLWLGKLNNNLGAVNRGLGNSIEALEYYQAALNIRRSIKDMLGVSNILNNIGIIYQDWGLNNEAFKWHNEALGIAQNIKNSAAIAYSYANIGKCFENKNEFEKALNYYQLGYETLLEDDKYFRSLSLFLVHIGRVNSKMGELKLALSNLKESLIYAQKINNKNRVAISEYHLGKTFLELNQLDSARKYINNSSKVSLQQNYVDLIRDNEFILSSIEEKKGNLSKALKHFKSASEMKDSTFNKEKITKFTDLQVKYSLEQKDKENTILKKNNEIQRLTINQQKNIRTGLMIIGVFAFIVLVIIARSRSSIKKLNLKLQESEKELLAINANKDKFFSIISHDLKSPFGGLLGIADMLVADYDELSKEEIKEMIQIVNHSSKNIYELLDGLLQWAQAQSGRGDYNFKRISILNTINKVIELHKITASSKKISIINNIDQNIFAFADELSIETILRNLVTNAIKFTNENGKIVSEAVVRNDKVYISVEDTGIGLSKDDLEKLFKIEYHLTKEGTNREIGTGLGLILCKELVAKNGGEIWAESEEGKGSKFVFTLPLNENNSQKKIKGNA